MGGQFFQIEKGIGVSLSPLSRSVNVGASTSTPLDGILSKKGKRGNVVKGCSGVFEGIGNGETGIVCFCKCNTFKQIGPPAPSDYCAVSLANKINKNAFKKAPATTASEICDATYGLGCYCSGEINV